MRARPALSPWNPLHYSGFVILSTLELFFGLVAILLLNVNLTGPHRLYRDRLARSFIQDEDNNAAPVYLKEINKDNFAPYHLINATVNLPSSTDPALCQRRSDFFLFSREYCGAPSVGYEKTFQWKTNGADADLATAMAVSGAAASSYMGLGSIPSLTALLTFLNVRLGFWILRPDRKRWLRSAKHVPGPPHPGAACTDRFRHPHRLKTERAAAGCEIEISQTHAMFCRIHYPTGDMGLILYIKLSVTGNESELIKRYRLLHTDFPNQTTLDQFFDEEQFEAYRQLGVHVTEGLFSPALMRDHPSPTTISQWFRDLAESLLEPEKM